MALCEHCEAELIRPQQRLPEPWFDHDAHTIAGQNVPPVLWRMLEVLWRRRRMLVARESMMALLYGHRIDEPDDHNITVYACRLRLLLAPTPFAIKNERNHGYRLIERK